MNIKKMKKIYNDLSFLRNEYYLDVSMLSNDYDEMIEDLSLYQVLPFFTIEDMWLEIRKKERFSRISKRILRGLSTVATSIISVAKLAITKDELEGEYKK